MDTCCRHGVAPIRYPVFRSCEVVPPLEAAMQTMAATLRAVTLYGADTHPRDTKISEVSSRVAMVIPEIGLDELPISPVRRELTVTKRNPKTMINRPPRMFSFSDGASQQARMITAAPAPTSQSGRSLSVRAGPAPPPTPLRLFSPRAAPATMPGAARGLKSLKGVGGGA